MTTKDTLDGIEQTLDTIEDSLDVIEATQRVEKVGSIVFAFTVIGGAGALGWFLAKRRYKRIYAELAQEEIAEAKEFYALQYKADEYSTPAGAAKALGTPAAVAADAVNDYSGREGLAEELRVTAETTEHVTTPIVPGNVFANRDSSDKDIWDLAEEIKNRTEETPYVISHDEYMESDREYEQHTLKYYAEDDVLCEVSDRPVETVDDVVGEENLTKFGHGSKDNRIVYVRNDRLNMDFEIVKYDESYAQHVAGFSHSDERKVPRFRQRGDDA